jgi:hypothetical protein
VEPAADLAVVVDLFPHSFDGWRGTLLRNAHRNGHRKQNTRYSGVSQERQPHGFIPLHHSPASSCNVVFSRCKTRANVKIIGRDSPALLDMHDST